MRLSQSLKLETPDGEQVPLMPAGAELPQTALIFVRIQPAADEITMRVLTECGAELVRLSLGPGPATPPGEAELRSIELAIGLAPSGVFCASAAEAGRMWPLLCATMGKAPIKSSFPEEQRLHEQAPEELGLHEHAMAASGRLRVGSPRSSLYVGLVEGQSFTALIEPGLQLPVSAECLLDTGHGVARRLFFDLLVISPSDLYAKELECLERVGSFDLIEDDYDGLLEFSFDEARLRDNEQLRLLVNLDEQHNLTVRLKQLSARGELATKFLGSRDALNLAPLAEELWADEAFQAE